MKGRSALATMFACLLLTHTTAVAWAQDEEEEGASEEEETSAEEAPAEGEGEEAAENAEEAVEEATDGAAAAGGRWPRAVIARPLTLPKGLIQVGAGIAGNNDFSVIGLPINGGYGISDKLDIRVSYGITLKEFEAKGPLGFSVGYNVLTGSSGGKLDVAVRAGTGYDLLFEGLSPLVIGGDIRYKLSDKLAIISPPTHLNIALEEITVGIQPATASFRPIFLTLPVGVGFQATPELYATVVTSLATIEIADSDTGFIFADFTPVTVNGTYSVSPNLDAYAQIGTDLSNSPGDALTFLVGANYYMGAL